MGFAHLPTSRCRRRDSRVLTIKISTCPLLIWGVRWVQQASIALMKAGAIQKGPFVCTDAFGRAIVH